MTRDAIIYDVDDLCALDCNAGLMWDDTAIAWPLGEDSRVRSAKDATLPDVQSPFRMEVPV